MTPAFAAAGVADPYVFRQASLCASHLVRKCRFAVDAWEDLRQEMVLDLLRRLPRFRPERGDWHGFVRGVMRHRSTLLAADERRRLLYFPDAAGGNDGDDDGEDFAFFCSNRQAACQFVQSYLLAAHARWCT